MLDSITLHNNASHYIKLHDITTCILHSLVTV